jgi:signal peptidase I
MPVTSGRRFLGIIRALRYIHALVGTAAGIIFTVVLIERVFVTLVVVSGHSMDPSLRDGQIIPMLRHAPWSADPQKGDVAVLHATQRRDVRFIKRVAGVPGDTVLVGGVAVVIPPGQFYVLGDNRPGSTDSRVYGLVAREQLVGAVLGVPNQDPMLFAAQEK